jgi:hypothetical protein
VWLAPLPKVPSHHVFSLSESAESLERLLVGARGVSVQSGFDGAVDVRGLGAAAMVVAVPAIPRTPRRLFNCPCQTQTQTQLAHPKQ